MEGAKQTLYICLFLAVVPSLSHFLLAISLIFLSVCYEAKKKKQELYEVQYEAWLAVYSPRACRTFTCTTAGWQPALMMS